MSLSLSIYCILVFIQYYKNTSGFTPSPSPSQPARVVTTLDLLVFDNFSTTEMKQSFQATFQTGIKKRHFFIIFRSLNFSNRVR